MSSFCLTLRVISCGRHFVITAQHVCVPVSILSGDRDGLVKIQTSRALVQYFKVDLVVLAYCGHDITIDAPAKLAHYLFEIICSPEQDTGEQFADSADLLNE